MKLVNTMEEITSVVNNSNISIVYFTGSSCGACEVIKKKVEKIIKNYEGINAIEVNGEKNISLAAEFNVFSLPLLLLFTLGKESLRVGRNINIVEFEEKLSRYYDLQ